MQFKEKSRELFTYAWYFFSIVEFYIDIDTKSDNKEIIHNFINSPQNFDIAHKYVGGYTNEHTNIKGETKIFKMYDFGPYPIDLLEINDYKSIKLEDFENEFFDLLLEFTDKKDIKLVEFTEKANSIFKTLNDYELYQLKPDIWKYNDLSIFQLPQYLCAFTIDRKNGILKIIQIAQD